MSKQYLDRDIILLAGQTCSGKTTARNILTNQLQSDGLPTPLVPVVDAQYFLQRIALDDSNGGFGHYHEWCQPSNIHERKGHTHDKNGTVPYIITSQDIVDGALFDYFSALNQLPRGFQLYITELAGGKNANPATSTQANIDVSFTYMAKLLRRDAFPSEWMNRVLAVIHPIGEPRKMHDINAQIMATRPLEIVTGSVSPQKFLSTLDVFGKDDFTQLEPLLKEHGVHRIYHTPNTYDHAYTTQLGKIGDTLTEDTIRQATSLNRQRDLVLFCGQHSAGIPQLVSQLRHRATLKHIAYEEELISDLPILIDKVHEDDKNGGRNHYHQWCEDKTDGHVHDTSHNDKSFTVVGNTLIDPMQQDYFTRLSNLPRSGKLWLAELTGGENTNPFSEPAYATDCSFLRVSQKLHEHTLPTAWVNRVLAVVHPVVASDTIRNEINNAEYVESLSNKGRAVLRGRSSQTVLKIFGKDDFNHLEKYLQDRHVPHIFTIMHDDSSLFQLRLEHVLDSLLDCFKQEAVENTA